MFYLNKLVGALISPMGMAFALLLLSVLFFVLSASRKWARKAGIASLLSLLVWMWVWSTPALVRVIGISLEREYWADKTGHTRALVPAVESFPQCEAIVILGGGMGFNKAVSPYAEMWTAADRVWHAARAWKAKKAPIVIPTGMGCAESDSKLLMDLGVPEENIRFENQARNTEENAIYTEKIVKSLCKTAESGAKPKVLLVTSAWHMKRSLLMFEQYAPGLDVVPCATDFETTVRFAGKSCSLADFFPDATSFWYNSILFHEILGYWGYRVFR